MNLLRKIWDWIAGQFIRDVPQDNALCEFDCRKPQCHQGEWETCTRRLQRAAGELMPAKKATSQVVPDSTPESNVVHQESDRV
jgi:hypothetical protein